MINEQEAEPAKVDAEDDAARTGSDYRCIQRSLAHNAEKAALAGGGICSMACSSSSVESKGEPN